MRSHFGLLEGLNTLLPLTSQMRKVYLTGFRKNLTGFVVNGPKRTTESVEEGAEGKRSGIQANRVPSTHQYTLPQT